MCVCGQCKLAWAPGALVESPANPQELLQVHLVNLAAVSILCACDRLQEPESNAEQQQKALQEDDIDNILARAEVVTDTKAEGGSAGDDLLASFNVATFQVCLKTSKSSECVHQQT